MWCFAAEWYVEVVRVIAAWEDLRIHASCGSTGPHRGILPHTRPQKNTQARNQKLVYRHMDV